jgi:predicted outer membrane repeat protein
LFFNKFYFILEISGSQIGGLVNFYSVFGSLALFQVNVSLIQVGASTYGGVVNVTKCSLVAIENSIFFNISAYAGAALCIYEVSSITILNSSFSFLKATGGSGGAILFGDYVGFLITSSSFSNNDASKNGGAIACSSNLLFGSDREIRSVNFVNNTCGTTGYGKDYADISTEQATIKFYTSLTLYRIISTSLSPKFYHVALLLSMDCLLDDTCSKDNVFVSYETPARDTPLCGSLSSPCLTISYALSQLHPANGGIYLLGINKPYYQGAVRFTSGMNVSHEGYGITDSTADVDYPKICPNYEDHTHLYSLPGNGTALFSVNRVNFCFESGSSFSGSYFASYMNYMV